MAARSESGSWPRVYAPRSSRQARQSSAVIAHLLERVAQRPQSVVHAALDRSLRDAELQGDLSVGAPAQVGLHEYRAVLVADPPQSLLDLPADEHVLERLVRHLRDVSGDDGASRARAAQVDPDVSQNREEPGSKRPDLGIEAIAGAPGAQERVLDGLLGHARILERSQGESVELAGMRRVCLADVRLSRECPLDHRSFHVLGDSMRLT